MAGSPRYKVYAGDEIYVACFKYFEDARAFADSQSEGTTVRDGHAKRNTIHTNEGEETFPQ